MHVFIIPSWYPHSCYPLEGRYVYEQAVAFSELVPDARLSLSLWAQGLGHITWAHLRHSPRCMLEFIRKPSPAEHMATDRVWEYDCPTWTWSHRLLGGHREGILRANRANLEVATRRLGRPSLIHAHVSYPAGWVALQLSRDTGLPFVVTEHMGPFPLPVYRQADGTLMAGIREPLEGASATIAVSPSLADRMVSFGLRRPEVIPNLVDERRYRAEPTRSGQPMVFFTLCGMEVAKGIEDLLDAMAILMPRLPDRVRSRLRFRLGGVGPALPRFQARARRLGLEPHVDWLGLVADERAREEFSQCDAFVLPSHHESFGIVYVEAMACGKPVIATRSGGPETIVRPEDGVLVDVHRPDQLADALEHVIEHRGSYDPERIREGFLARFSRPAVVDRLREVYERAIATPASGPDRREPTARGVR